MTAVPMPDVDLTAVIAANVRRLRTEHGWSGRQVADELVNLGVDWTRTTVAKLESGRRKDVTVREGVALAHVLGVDLNQLVGASYCPTCRGWPPFGFTCNDCGSS